MWDVFEEARLLRVIIKQKDEEIERLRTTAKRYRKRLLSHESKTRGVNSGGRGSDKGAEVSKQLHNAIDRRTKTR